MTPLQSSSMLLQTSGVGTPALTEQTVPLPSPVQMIEPVRAQEPEPAVHELPRPVKPSSVAPLQLSSRPLQSSVVGTT